jgi:hypothetical protein
MLRGLGVTAKREKSVTIAAGAACQDAECVGYDSLRPLYEPSISSIFAQINLKVSVRMIFSMPDPDE